MHIIGCLVNNNYVICKIQDVNN